MDPSVATLSSFGFFIALHIYFHYRNRFLDSTFIFDVFYLKVKVEDCGKILRTHYEADSRPEADNIMHLQPPLAVQWSAVKTGYSKTILYCKLYKNSEIGSIICLRLQKEKKKD